MDDNDTDQQPIIGFVVGTDDPVTMCAACGSQEINRVGEIRDNEAYGDRVPYPECHQCGGVLRPNDMSTEYACKRCGKRYDSIGAVKDHSRSHTGEVDVPLFEIVDVDHS